MSAWSLTYQQSALLRQQCKNIYKCFTYKMAAKTSWHRYGTKLRHCHPINYSYLLTYFLCIRTARQTRQDSPVCVVSGVAL